MAITTVSGDEFALDIERFKQATSDGPVHIIEHGTVAYVLLRIEAYRRLAAEQGNLVVRLGQPPGIEDVEFDVPRMRDVARPADHG